MKRKISINVRTKKLNIRKLIEIFYVKKRVEKERTNVFSWSFYSWFWETRVYLNLVNFVLDRIYEATKKFKWKSIVFLLGLFLSWIISLPVVIIRTKLFCVIFQFQVKSRYETAAGVQSWLRQVVKEPSKVIGRSTRKNSFSMILKPTGAIAFTRGYYFCQRCRCLYAYIFDELLSCRSNV